MNRICLMLTFSWIAVSGLPAGGEADGPTRSPITVHVLDTSLGKPAAGLTVVLERAEGKEWRQLGTGKTDAQGRIDNLLAKDQPLPIGVCRLTFESGAYFGVTKTKTFYPRITVIFEIDDTTQHYHMPLTLSPFGYSTYRGG